MKKNIPLIVILFLGQLGINSLLAQNDFQVPDYQIKSKQDCPQYNAIILQACTWLENTPLTEQPPKRKQIFQFVFQWATFSPDVHVEIYGYVMDFLQKNPDLLMVYTAAWIKAELQQPQQEDKKIYHLTATQSVLQMYAKGGLQKDAYLDKLSLLNQQNKLADWIAENWQK